MKKYIRQILIVLIVAVLTLSVLASCGTTTEKKYTVSFIADGKVVKTVETKGNEVIVVPDAPEKENYEFAGWYLDKWQWKQPFDGNNFADKALTSDVEVYAYYKEIPAPQKYNIYFNVDGELPDVIQSAGNEILTLPIAPEKRAFRFQSDRRAYALYRERAGRYPVGLG